MSVAVLERMACGDLKLSGVVDLHSGRQLHAQVQRLAAGLSGVVRVDCSGVAEGSSSVCLSLLLSLQRVAAARSARLVIDGLPQEMRRIAGMYGLLELLPLSG